MNIVFDFGGVLFRWRPHALLTRVLADRSLTDDAARTLAHAVFTGPWEEFDRGSIEPAALAEAISARAGLTVDEVRRVIDAVPAELAPVEHTVALLKRLKARGHRLVYLSNMPAPYADHLERSHDFLSLFETGVFSAREKVIKPEPAIYALAEQRFGHAPADLLFIDDLLANVMAAQQRGWQAIHFESPAQCEAELHRLGLLG